MQSFFEKLSFSWLELVGKSELLAEDGLVWDPVYGDFILNQSDNILNEEDSVELFSLYSTSFSFQAPIVDGNQSFDSFLARINSFPAQSHESDELASQYVQQFSKSHRRPICRPYICKTLLLKIMSGFEEAGILGPIENARRYTANLKKHLEKGNLTETLPQPINVYRQNVWLVYNLFDTDGNFLYCSQVIRKVFHLGSHRLSRLCL